MSSKFLLFPIFGIVVPLFLYLVFDEVRQYASLPMIPIGNVELLPLEIGPTDISNKQSDKIIFVGDVLMARHVEFLLSTKGSGYSFKYTPEIFAGATTIIGNFESAVLKNHIKTPSFVTTFSVDTKFLPLLREAGFTHVSLANNHSLDYGQETFEYTVEKLSQTGIEVLGHPQIVSSSSVRIIHSGDYNVGLLALNQVFSILSWEDITTQLNELASTSDFQIAYIHWGEEYLLKHNQTQEDIAKRLIDGGIDAVIGHHPHVTQDIQVYNGRPIFYSLGNFLFDQYFSVDVQQGLVLTLELSSSTVEYTITPVTSEGKLSQPYLMPVTEAGLFLKNLARRGDPVYAETIASGKLILPLYLASSTITGMIAP